MLVEFTLSMNERDQLLAHADVNSPRWKALMESVQEMGRFELTAGKIHVKCERSVAIELLGVAINCCDSAAKVIIPALKKALDS